MKQYMALDASQTCLPQFSPIKLDGKFGVSRMIRLGSEVIYLFIFECEGLPFRLLEV